MDKRIKLKDVIKTFRPELLKNGFIEFMNPHWSSIFCKQVNNGLFITLGFEKSNLYDNAWTASIYLGTTTIIGAIWGDIPDDSYQRVPNILDVSEKNAIGIPAVQDHWFSSLNDNSKICFCNALDIATQKMISNNNLVERINNSEASSLLKARIDRIMSIYSKGSNKKNYRYFPTDKQGSSMEAWYKASEEALELEDFKMSMSAVKTYGEYAHIQHKLTRE